MVQMRQLTFKITLSAETFFSISFFLILTPHADNSKRKVGRETN